MRFPDRRSRVAVPRVLLAQTNRLVAVSPPLRAQPVPDRATATPAHFPPDVSPSLSEPSSCTFTNATRPNHESQASPTRSQGHPLKQVRFSRIIPWPSTLPAI